MGQLVCEEPGASDKNAENNPARTTLSGIKSVALLLHGLNQHPRAFRALRKELRAGGAVTCSLFLRDHIPLASAKFSGSGKGWLEDVETAYNRLASQYPGIPRVAIGYSIGAALVLAFIEQHPDAHFDKFVFFAPAFSLRWPARAVRLLTPLRSLRLSIPSGSPKSYRVHSSTSLVSYRAALDICDSISQVADPQRLAHTPALVFLNDEDELIDSQGVRKWIKNNGLESWKVMPLDPKPDADFPEHLFIDPASLGKGPWDELIKTLTNFLQQ